MDIQDIHTENTTAIYGMRFGIAWEQTEGGHQNLDFKGKWPWTPNIVEDMYPRGILATTIITDISWDDENDHNYIANGNKLQVSVSFYFYTRNYHPLLISSLISSHWAMFLVYSWYF